MEFINSLIESYSTFFSIEAISSALLNPANWAIILSLIVLEGLLSADNALVLAVMVKHLPKEQQRKALFYGIVGAYIFRFIAIGLGVFLIKIWWIKILGGAYLLWLAISHFRNKAQADEDGNVKVNNIFTRLFGNFWGTVAAVELMDIAFSIDSVIAAFGVSSQIWVLFVGGILGVLMMRGVAQVFLKLIDKIPEFEATAFVLIAIIGVKMVGGAYGFHVKEVIFFSILVSVFLLTFVVHSIKKQRRSLKEIAVAKGK
jgi:YkoY family integral membrane protein